MTDSKKYYDATAAIQVIGCVLNDPSLLDDTGKYTFSENDFINDFHKIIFGSLYNLYNNGTTRLNTKIIEDYLQNKPRSLAIYNANKGAEWLHNTFKEADLINFDYYYSRLRKMTLLRSYCEIGCDVSWIYNVDNVFDSELREEQDRRLDDYSLTEIADMIDNKITRIREMVINKDSDESCQIGDESEELYEELLTKPAIGYPLYDKIFDAIAMGGREGKFYLRSAATGVGKSRSAMADACWLACSEIYENNEWVSTGENIPTIFISVELDKTELQTMAWSFVSGVSETHILENNYAFGERERVLKAIQILKESSLYIEYFPDYSMKDIENCIKRNIVSHKCRVVFLDYITSSMKIIEEITRAAGGMKIREDQVLFLLSSKLKDIASTRNVFIFSSTQINGTYKTEKILDQTLLAGAKSIANRIDFGSIMLDCTPEDIESIQPILTEHPELGIPNIKCSVYKNRRGKINRVLLWMQADKGTCRYKTRFVTDYNLNWINQDEIISEKLDETNKEG